MIPIGLLPEGTIAVIAGGWPACPPMARDMDVWVLAQGGEPLDDIKVRLLAHLRTTKPYRYSVKELDDHVEERVEYDTMPFDTIKVAELSPSYPQGSVKIHLMVTNASSAFGLISAFDISTHQVALDQRGLIIRGEGFTDLFTPPVVLRQTETTDERMKKICARYGFTKELPVADES